MRFPRDSVDREILETAKESIEKIKETSEKSEEISTEALETFTKEGLPGFAKKKHMEDLLDPEEPAIRNGTME